MYPIRRRRHEVLDMVGDLELCLDLEREFGPPTEEPPPCQHGWAFVPPRRSVGMIPECKGYGVLVCRACGDIRTAESEDLDEFKAGKIDDILLSYPKGTGAGKSGDKNI